MAIDGHGRDGLDGLDWGSVAAQLDTQGYALLSGGLAQAAARQLGQRIAAASPRRTRLETLGWGQGGCLDIGPAWPEPLRSWRAHCYAHLAGIANRWNAALGVARRYPPAWEAFQLEVRRAGPQRQPSYASLLAQDDYMALRHGDLDSQAFPIQMFVLLSEPGRDFSGGEFVMTEQRPRMQSRPMVVPLGLGDIAFITAAQRPVAGKQGNYRATLRQAVSRVRAGERIGLELYFHDTL
ncbi:2OG-Fe(II) oxygenase [Kerstersia sp.]|uniref:2OG-Fe(II) oxygenase n=1 Tax=Kerstersia sp. TaxID=1930783 RepID=UPI003F8DA1AF